LTSPQRAGRNVPVALPDGAPLSHDRLPRSWADSAPPRWILQVITEGKTRMVDGGRAIKNRRNRPGNTGHKKRRGRPSHNAHTQRQWRPGLSQPAQATCLWDQQYRLVRTQAALREQAKEDRVLLVQIAPELTLFRPCHQPFSRRFARGISQP
jgi:hypothetical protein